MLNQTPPRPSSRRVLLISSNSSGRGGGERYLVYLSRGLHQLGYEVHALLSSADYMDPWQIELEAEGVRVHRYPLTGLRDRRLRFISALLDRSQQERLAAICREIAPCAILVNQQYDEDGLDYLRGALNAEIAPVLGTMHMPMTREKHRRPLGRTRGAILRRWYSANVYRPILVSEGSRAEFEAYYPSPRPTHLVHYGCVFGELPDHLPSPFEGSQVQVPVVAFVGQLVAQKNLSLLVDAWLWARANDAVSRLLLIGDGPERQELEHRLASEAPPGSWHITGWQPRPEGHLISADLYMMTSHYEGLPLALVEAAAMGLPCVVTDFNGAADVAERASWVRVVESRQTADVGRALATALADLPSLRERARSGQEEFKRYFSPERMARDTLAVAGIR